MALLERTNPCGKLPLCGIPPPRRCRGTPLWQGGLWSVRFFQPGNVTGHWRGSNDLLKIPVGNWLRPLAAEIVSGDSPPGGIRRTVTVPVSYPYIIHHPSKKIFPKNSHLMIPGKILSPFSYFLLIIILIMIRGRFSDLHLRVFRPNGQSVFRLTIQAVFRLNGFVQN